MKGRAFIIGWLWNKMAFMKRKGVKFTVDLQVCNLSDVPLVNAVVFSKIRLLDGGSFEDSTERVEVVNHGASWSHRSEFACRIACEQSTGTLEKCLCRISIRKEQKGGKTFYKLGYVDINLSEFAASGVEGMTRSYLLNGYTTNQRLDNSKVLVKVTMCHQSADPFFSEPRATVVGGIEDGSLNPEAFRATDATEHNSEEGSSHVTFRTVGHDHPPGESGSVASSSLVMEDVSPDQTDPRRTTSSSIANPSSSNALRRFSQDRSAQKIQSTRIDAGGVIDRVLAESRLSDASYVPESQGLALYLDKDGRPLVGRAPSKATLMEDSD
ncbi:unnamed protein product [Caenorhabditis auriculariae]|uniref:C2 NT-type domain-containing protein n=1 Tax=Caenorhabditis auriculariae TaxID=2777116 RepID=A0A8S1HCU3_9PELO|nr:unnamed protein product [Caenorhabditis auriculariae]